MSYSRQFKAFREGRGLTREQLAEKAGCHRNTVINVESGRPVKFATIRELMGEMGYSEHSPETRLLALMWLEAVTGVSITRREAEHVAAGTKDQRGALRELESDVAAAALQPEDIALLRWAARRPPALKILRSVRDLMG
jgi:transcriptional regulator with XRE-family HTH domain